MAKLSLFFIILLILLISACSSGRYADKHDSTPARLPTQAELVDALPRAEPYSRGGNKAYTVRGKHYTVLSSTDNFSEEGIASWYGNKFHGHLTSNGEIYDMYAMTAAHKNLPLPSYVKVTNTVNNKSVIVRVNDRGPFHESRIIDLSYSAAYKLDMLKTGTAQVKVRAITSFETLNPSTTSTSISNAKGMGIQTPYIQVFATRRTDVANNTAIKLRDTYPSVQVATPKTAGVYRVQLGPIDTLEQLNTLLSGLKANGYPNAFPREKP